jgi:hypothetical protein
MIMAKKVLLHHMKVPNRGGGGRILHLHESMASQDSVPEALADMLPIQLYLPLEEAVLSYCREGPEAEPSNKLELGSNSDCYCFCC